MQVQACVNKVRGSLSHGKVNLQLKTTRSLIAVERWVKNSRLACIVDDGAIPERSAIKCDTKKKGP